MNNEIYSQLKDLAQAAFHSTDAYVPVTTTGQMQVYSMTVPYYPSPAPCPSCGHCPTCGRGGHQFQPYWPRYTWGTTCTGLGGSNGL